MTLAAAVAALSAGAAEPAAPPLNFRPGPEYADADREFQGIPSIARAPGGRLWATWYGGGKGEGPDNYIMLATSGDDGSSWSDLKLVVDPPFRASEPGVWVDPLGRLWLMLNLYPEGLCGGSTELWTITTDAPDEENPTWSAPRLLARDLNNFNKPIVLESGVWLWPTGNWWKGRDLVHPSRPLLSADDGQTFKPGGPVLVPPDVREFDEYNVVQLRDGRLWVLTRTKGGPHQAFSTDGGRTWTKAEPHPTIKHAVARHFLTRLRSGKLLLVKHGEIDRKIGRTRLMAFVSDDDGQTWQGGLTLDEREVSYPDGCQAPDGTIYVIYDHERTRAGQILTARFAEEDVLAGRLVSDRSALRLVINDAGGRKRKPERGNADGEPLRIDRPGVLFSETVETKAAKAGEPLFCDRDYRLKEWPKPFDGAVFLRVHMDGTKRLRCVRAGMVYFLTPLPDRNRDSQSKTLLGQSFRRVALPEVELFDHPSVPATYCTLYQKECEEGETIEFGKWAVPVLLSQR